MHGRHSYVAYIDEAGDEGFVFRATPGGQGGSSRWFVLAAAIGRVEDDNETVRLIRDVRSLLGLPVKHHLHFRKLHHERRVAFAGMVAAANHVRTIVVAIDKTALDSPERFMGRGRLYHYATRLLVERISWVCRDGSCSHGDGTVRLIFDNRSKMSYEAMREYMRVLQSQDNPGIHWPALDIDAIGAMQSAKLAGLQLADAVASGYYQALTVGPYGYAEDRYMREMWPRAYAYSGEIRNYGLKVFPSYDLLDSLVPWVTEKEMETGPGA